MKRKRRKQRRRKLKKVREATDEDNGHSSTEF